MFQLIHLKFLLDQCPFCGDTGILCFGLQMILLSRTFKARVNSPSTNTHVSLAHNNPKSHLRLPGPGIESRSLLMRDEHDIIVPVRPINLKTIAMYAPRTVPQLFPTFFGTCDIEFALTLESTQFLFQMLSPLHHIIVRNTFKVFMHMQMH